MHAGSRPLQEYGRLVRTVYLSRYVADEELRRRVRRQLNKAENLQALRRDLFFARQGHVRGCVSFVRYGHEEVVAVVVTG